jgi:hypothetical protein
MHRGSSRGSLRVSVGGQMKKAFLLATLVGLLVFAFAGTAFGTYGQTFSGATLAPGGTLTINPTFTKATADPGPTSTHYFEVKVTGPNAENAVVGAADGTWYPPVPTESGPGFIHFTSNEYITWVGNAGTLNPPPPSIKFNETGAYLIEVRMCADSGVYPSPTWLSSNTYLVVVGAPVVITPASSPWSLALAAACALGVGGVSAGTRRRAARSNR